jgi:hypothetical protein
MIIEAIISLIGFLFDAFLTLLASAFSGFDLVVVDLSTGFGYIVGNIWLLNDFLPVDQLMAVFAIAMTWHIALFTYDGFLYLMTLWNLAKRTIFSLR